MEAAALKRKENQLNEDDVRDLVIRFNQGYEEAFHKIYVQYKGFIYQRVYRFRATARNRATIEDLEQLALIGLYKSIRDFKVDAKIKFITYLAIKVDGEIANGLRDGYQSPVGVKFPREMAKIVFDTVSFANENEISVSKAIDVLGYDSKTRALVSAFLGKTKYLEDIVESEQGKELTLGDLIDCDDTDIEMATMMIDLMRSFNHNENQVFQLKFVEGMSQDKISKAMDYSQAHISRLERSVKRKIVEYLGGE